GEGATAFAAAVRVVGKAKRAHRLLANVPVVGTAHPRLRPPYVSAFVAAGTLVTSCESPSHE
ncbi:MAG: hypothetical protein WA702_03330, partial [Bradyrhizobium sp.]|uniref:hypothetical protein n=1 Tax=Bradyrhizobium sp. TaxID=376 RepID=UPI003C7D1E1E